MAYLKISITTSAELAEVISAYLMEQSALSVSLEDAADQELFQLEPNETPLWQHTKVVALFTEQTNPDAIIEQLAAQLNLSEPLDCEIEQLAEQDWVRLTQQQFQPQCYAEQLWVCPSWYDTHELTGDIVRIDPGLAFGTGTHPTTALCLDWLAKHPPHKQIVIDYGCGSGILALATLALGAKEVFAVDHDTQALEATYHNGTLNAFVKEQLYILLPEQLPVIKADVVIANILANPLIELAPLLIERLNPNGQLILSGILEKEIATVAAAYEKKLTQIDVSVQDEWARLVFLNEAD